MAKRSGGKKPDQPNGSPAPRKAGTYFTSLTVRNVRCFGDEPQTLSFVDQSGRLCQWTILLGENGTGKTTLLQSLLGLEPVPYLWAPKDGREVLRAEDWSRRGKIERMLRESNAPMSIAASFADVALGTTVHDSLDRRLELTWSGGRLEVPPDLSLARMLGVYPYGADRGHYAPREAEPYGDEPPDAESIDDFFEYDTFLRNGEDWLIRLDYSVARSTSPTAQRELLEKVKTLLIGLLPDVTAIDLRSTLGPYPRAMVEFATPYGVVPLRGLGHGYQTMFRWVIDLISRLFERHPNHPNPLSEPSVVLIDEIDLHLHPRWQRGLFHEFSTIFPNTQFIATAHSPLIVQAAAEIGANLAVLRREGDHVVIENDVDLIRGLTIDQILTSDLFGLATARPPGIEPKIKRRTALLSKATLTPKDKAEVKRLESEIGPLPAGSDYRDAKKMLELIEENRRVLEELRGNSS